MRALLLVSISALALAGAGCGGGGGGGGDRLSKEEFASKGNAICADFKKELDAVPEPSSFEEVLVFVDKAIPIFDEHLDQLKELRPPEDLQETRDDWIAFGDKARGRLDDFREAAEDEDEEKLNELGRETDAEDKESDRLANELGLTTCANL